MNLILLIIGAGIFGVGALATYIVFVLLRERQAVQSWDTTPGRITKSYVEAYTDEDLDQMYRAVIEYEYTVDNFPYMGDQIAKNDMDGASVEGMMQKRVDKYPVGAQVDVVYNPDDHGEAYLERAGSIIVPITLGIFALFFVIFGGIMLVLGFGIVGQ